MTKNHTFEEAVTALKAGLSVCPGDYADSGCTISLKHGVYRMDPEEDTFPFDEISVAQKYFDNPALARSDFMPVFELEDGNGMHHIWLPTLEDILREDWCVFEEGEII